MIRFIAAIDSKNGLADETGIPWQGKTPREVKYFRDKTLNGIVLMGYRTYQEFSQPLKNRQNLVATSSSDKLRAGFESVNDAVEYLAHTKNDVWVIGGAGLFENTIDLAGELYITQLEGDFHCTKFFPEFRTEFELIDSSETIVENGISYSFQIWKRKKS